MKEWVPIPFTNGKYEITREGDVRNSKTKHILKGFGRYNNPVYRFYCNGECLVYTTNQLLKITFGISRPSLRKISVTVSKDDQVFHFDSLRKAAEFLAPHVFYSSRSFYYFFKRKRSEIGDWSISYEK